MHRTVFYAFNRSAARRALFTNEIAYARFRDLMFHAARESKADLYAFCLMPTHWHVVVGVASKPEMTRFLYSMARGSSRFDEFFQLRLVKREAGFYEACRHVERNPIIADLVPRAEDWPWSSLFARRTKSFASALASWPLGIPSDWWDQVNRLSDVHELPARPTSPRPTASPSGISPREGAQHGSGAPPPH